MKSTLTLASVALHPLSLRESQLPISAALKSITAYADLSSLIGTTVMLVALTVKCILFVIHLSIDMSTCL
jgi:hypothetical protein